MSTIYRHLTRQSRKSHPGKAQRPVQTGVRFVRDAIPLSIVLRAGSESRTNRLACHKVDGIQKFNLTTLHITSSQLGSVLEFSAGPLELSSVEY